MIAGDAATVAELNERARADRVLTGAVSGFGVRVADGHNAGTGDWIVTRQNDRNLPAGAGRWVKNGDRWMVAVAHPDGSLTVTRVDGKGEAWLPTPYVTQHVELAYASTAHRAQGRTVDTAHVMVSPITSREILYVAATRGRQANHLYVDTHFDPDPATGHDGSQPAGDAYDVLVRVLANEGAEVSAHETLWRAKRLANSWVTLHAEYQSIAAVAQRARWDHLVASSGLTEAEQELIGSSPARGALYSALQEADSAGLNVVATFPRLARSSTLADAEDLASVLQGRVRRWIVGTTRGRLPDRGLISGLVPRASRVDDPDMAKALAERERAMERRSQELASVAISRGHVWTRRLGHAPSDPVAQQRWMYAIATVAGYRDRWSVGNDHRPLGPDKVSSIEHLQHRRRAQVAVETALAIVRQDAANIGAPSAAPSVQPAVQRKGVAL